MVFIFLAQTILFIYFFQICLTSYVQMKEKERFKNQYTQRERKETLEISYQHEFKDIHRTLPALSMHRVFQVYKEDSNKQQYQ